MVKTSRKAQRKIVKTWLETTNKVIYTDLMDKMEAGDLRSMVLVYAVQKFKGAEPPKDTTEVATLQMYYSQPLKFQKEILTL